MLVPLFLALFSLYLSYKLLLSWVNGNNDFWPKRGVPVILPSEYASYFDLLAGRKDFKSLEMFYYNKYKDAPYVGVMELRSPTIMVRDLDLLNKIFIKDFEYFLDRRPFDLGGSLTDKILGNMRGQQWKEMRMAMSPLFTTSKIRRIFEQFSKSSKQMVDYVKRQSEKQGSPDMHLSNLFRRFAMDVIASTAFGMDSQCLTKDDSLFLKMANNVQTVSRIKILLLGFAPKLAKLLGVTAFNQEPIQFFQQVIETNVRNREKNGGHYADFLQLMLEIKGGKGGIILEEELDNFEKEAQLKTTSGVTYKPSSLTTITNEEILANAIIFFLAGLDTVQSLMSLAAYHCAIYPEMQDRLRKEIEDVAEEFNGDINYDGITKMAYLDMFLTELTRLYTPATKTERVTHKDYKIPGSDVVIPAGTIVNIPIWAIQTDEKYYPDPQKFDPDRFSPDDKTDRNKILAFGQGPRNCIGKRLALTETKAAIAHLILNFDIAPCADTYVPIKLEVNSLALKPVDSLKVSLIPRK